MTTIQNLDTKFATNLGAQFAAEINANPSEAQNWRALERGDDLPEFDYIALRDHYNFDNLDQSDINEIERAYRDGFNAVFES